MIQESHQFTQDTELRSQYVQTYDMTLTIGIYSSMYRGFYGNTGDLIPNKIAATGEYLYSLGAETNFGTGVHIQCCGTNSTSYPPSGHTAMKHDYKLYVYYNGRYYTCNIKQGEYYHYGADAVEMYNLIINLPQGTQLKCKFVPS